MLLCRISLITLLAVFGSSRAATSTVPGCPDVDVLDSEAEIDQETLNNLLLCFCKVHGDDKVAISCLYGSNPEHLRRATNAVANSTFTVDQISIQHMEFGDDGLPDMGSLAPELQGLEIRECSSPNALHISNDAFKGIQNLKNLTINGCNLLHVPEAISNLPALETLVLSENKLDTIHEGSLKNKTKLRYLDLSGNMISHLESGAFDDLQDLNTIVFGERNYMNETVLEEMAKLKNLKTLDLSRADGIFETPTELLAELTELEILKLSGCSIPTIEAGSFVALGNLKQLDLRVNLIENISAYAFDGLSNLERLSLAGNYIRFLEKDMWTGLSNLKEIDLGWNEIKEVPEGAFAPLSENLKNLNLRHNPLKEFPTTGLKNVEFLSLSECQFRKLNASALEEYPKLQGIDLSKCNLSEVSPEAFANQKELKVLHLEQNALKTINGKNLKDLPALEELNIAGNPFLCDNNMAEAINTINDRYKMAAKEGRDFLVVDSNETLCDRPYSFQAWPVLGIDTSELQPYDESLDTTTIPSTTTAEFQEHESTTPFKLPNIFVGSNTNDTLFKEEPRREVYDISKYDNTKHPEEANKDKSYVMPATIIVIGAVSLIAIVAVGLFMKKKRKLGANSSLAKSEKNRNGAHSAEDGMVEIELNDQNSRKH